MSKEKQVYTAREKSLVWQAHLIHEKLEDRINDLEASIKSFMSMCAENYPEFANWVYDERYEALNTKYNELLEKYYTLLDADDERQPVQDEAVLILHYTEHGKNWVVGMSDDFKLHLSQDINEAKQFANRDEIKAFLYGQPKTNFVIYYFNPKTGYFGTSPEELQPANIVTVKSE
jgi:hypothetical protein